MKEAGLTLFEALAIVLLTGALGGAGIGSHVFLSKRGFKAAFILAYTIIGTAMAGVVGLYLLWTTGTPVEQLTDEALLRVLLFALAGGMLGSLALGSLQYATGWVLRYKGLEIQVSLKKPEDCQRER